MGRPTTEQLTSMALAALEEAAALCRHEPQPQTRGLALALAFLAHVSERSDRYQFDRFWRCLRIDCNTMRPAEAFSALNGIYEAVARTRELETISAFQRAAAMTYGLDGLHSTAA